jgi:hypothetical protein
VARSGTTAPIGDDFADAAPGQFRERQGVPGAHGDAARGGAGGLDRVTTGDLEALIVSQVGGRLSGTERRWLASIAVAERAWRNTVVEDAHAGSGLGRISDGEMFAANVGVTRLVHSQYRPAGTDWTALFDVLTDPTRAVGASTVAGLLGSLYHEWVNEADAALDSLAAIEELRGPRWAHLALVLGAAHSGWWGTPWWPDMVAAFVAEITGIVPQGVSSEGLHDALLSAPDALPIEVLEWSIDHGVGFASSKGRAAWLSRRTGR